MFNYDYLPRTELQASMTDQGRVYLTPQGREYPSVTTVLKAALSDKKLEEWIRAVGEEEAKRISKQAIARGNEIHVVCEDYLKGEDTYKGMMPGNKDLFLRVKPKLDSHITKIYGIEFPVYSDLLRTAGRIDAIIEWLGRNAILDFKTARKPLRKGDDRLGKYFLQTTTYAMMVEEQYKIEVPYCVIIVFPATHDDPQVIIKSNEKFRGIVEGIFKGYVFA